jgi:hypothetical protein
MASHLDPSSSITLPYVLMQPTAATPAEPLVQVPIG